uniref:Disintegrin and metalloproteinase domain-containing protein 10 n=1 Tax=Takifugu rubripes TaxID=31033 RepID=A0A674MJ06_TAKRU
MVETALFAAITDTFPLALRVLVWEVLPPTTCRLGNPLNKYIRHYEGLSYDTGVLHSSHQRAKRALSPEEKTVQLDFHAHGRHFNLRMTRDTSIFSPDLVVDVSGEEASTDTSHIYTGEIFDYPHKYGSEGGCADHSVFDRMRKYQASAVEQEKHAGRLFICLESLNGKWLHRLKRSLFLQISSHVKAINSIYQVTDFKGIRNISFMVKRIRINTTDVETDRSNPFRFANIGVEKFLELNSEQNHDDYCLAYVFTDRDFDDGVLGLAWVGAPSGSSGGICEKSKLYSDGKKKSLNTGIITVQNYGSHVPPKVSHITFAHEVGHNFGSPHDSGLECTPGESKSQDKKERGNYIMYARATSGDKLNNNKFSSCSIGNISAVLLKKRDDCFVESGQPICGNGMVEPGEECDCGYSDQCKDPCCYSANEAEGKRCKLQPGKICSPSQGPCCTAACAFKGTNERCRLDSDCAKEGKCNGATALCPASEPKENFTSCNSDTQVCLSGVCSGSICAKHNLEECTCVSKEDQDEAAELCHVCCMEKMNPSTCSSSGSDKWAKFFNRTIITLQPGSPCNDFKGYCDVFMRCRLVDADGPLARLKKAIFNAELYENIAEWIVAHWWAVLLMGIALIMLMAGFIKICSVHTPSSNPKLPPPKPLPGTLKRRRPQQATQQAQGQRHYRQPMEDYQLGQMRR